MRVMLREGIAFADIEELQEELSSKFRSKLFRNQARTNSKLVRNPVMKVKLEDEMCFLRELRSDQARARRELGKRMSPNSKPFRKTLAALREEARKTKHELQSKYTSKIKHLRKKYSDEEGSRKTDLAAPEDLEAFKELSAFDEEKFKEIKVEKYSVSVIGDIQLSDGERSVLELHPKYAIPPDLQEGGLELEQERANTKYRFERHKEIEREEMTEEEVKEGIENDARSRQVFDPVLKCYDSRKSPLNQTETSQ